MDEIILLPMTNELYHEYCQEYEHDATLFAKRYEEIFADIYNSAIHLFPEEERGMATPDVFAEQIKNDVNFIHINEQGVPDAFASYRKRSGQAYELTSLYVSRDSQNKGIATDEK